MKGIIKAIMIGCKCSEKEAKEYYRSEVDYLRELASLNDLRYGDFEAACSNLGIDYDYAMDFINAVGV